MMSTSPAKETWEKLTSDAKEDEATTKTFEMLDSLDQSLKSSDFGEEEEKGFRLPYSSRPRVTNGRWK